MNPEQANDDDTDVNEQNRLLQFILHNIAVHHGHSNQDMVRHLKERSLFTRPEVEEAMLAVPRGEFIPADQQDEAYVDMPMRLHQYSFNVSAPHMYAMCLEALEISPGQSFLDIGSGCGLMTAQGGYLVGQTGRAVGWEVRGDIIDLSIRNLAAYVLRRRSKRGMESEAGEDVGFLLSTVVYEEWNCFLPTDTTFDRIHVGAACPVGLLDKLVALLNPGGILVTPCGEEMLKITKDENHNTHREVLMRVRYGDLAVPSEVEIKAAQVRLEQRRSTTIAVPPQRIFDDYGSMLDDSKYSDFVLEVGEEGATHRIHVHRAILAARSDFFRALLQSGMREVEEGHLRIPSDMNAGAVRTVLREMYTGMGADEITPETALEILEAASFFKMERLKALCERSIKEYGLVDVENVAVVMRVAHRFNANQLKRVCMEFILKHYDEVSRTQAFKEMGVDLIVEVTQLACSRAL